MPREAFDTIITSGDVTAQLIAAKPDAPLFHFGPARDHSVLDGLANPIVDLPNARLCLLTGPLDDTIESVDVYKSQLQEMSDNSVDMICANPDMVVRSGDRMVICAGSIAQSYARLGGKVTYAGKLEPAIYDEALRRAAILAGHDVPKRRLLVIGDGLLTDMKGAADNGFDAYFVTGGIHASDFGEINSAHYAERAISIIKDRCSGLNLVGMCEKLSWA